MRDLPRCRFACTIILSTLALSAAPAALAAWSDDGAASVRRGSIIETPANPVRFAPESTAVRVDAETVDLRQVFEDLGPEARLWYQHVQTLANPFFQGRVPESRGKEIAAEYIEFYLREYGLKPAFPANADGNDNDNASSGNWHSYRQPFEFNMLGRRMRASVRNEVVAINDQSLKPGEDFVVLGVSGSGRVTAPVSFVGYGIEDGPDGYSSFDGDTDLTGRIALLFRYEPLDDRGRSQWGDRGFSAHASIAPKLRALRDRGAAGIILVNPPDARGAGRELETIGRSSQFGPALTIPAVQVTPDVAERIMRLGDAQPKSLLTWRQMADNNAVRTVELDNRVRITIGADVERSGARQGVEAENVGAVLRGRGDLADQWLVIGAHYDHIGTGEFGTSPQYRGQLHPGADDNASGTAGLLILAKTLAEAYAKAGDNADLRSILFIAFSAEESGLHGSRYFVNNPTIDLDSITAMINMDMIGRVRDDKIVILGSGTAHGLEHMLTPHVEASGLQAALFPGGSGRSDCANFINNEIPAMHFFTGMHSEYHAPMDKAYTMNPAGARDVLRLIHDVAMELVAMPQQLTFTTPPRVATRDRGYGPVRLGIRPGMGDDLDRGILIDEVSKGTSADDAGIQGGDVLLAWDGAELADLRDLFERLQSHEPGDVVRMTVLRDDEQFDVDVTLKSGEQ